MKISRKIDSVKVLPNGVIRIKYRGRDLDLNYKKNNLSFNFKNLHKVYVDKELGEEAITLLFINGEEDSVPLDAFLEEGKDPDFYKDLCLYEMTLLLIEKFEESEITKSKLAKSLDTSMSQINRLMDTSNKSKTIDQIIKALAVLGHKIVLSAKAILQDSVKVTDVPFVHLSDEEMRNESRDFKPLKLVG